MRLNYRAQYILQGLLLLIFFFTSCKRLVEVAPPITGSNGANVYASDATAIATVTSMYVNTSAATFNIPTMFAVLPALGADELTLWSGNTNTQYAAYYQDNLNATIAGFEFWHFFYSQLYIANDAIEQLGKTNALTPAVKQQLTGEAKFSRAFFYFYLVNLYGDVPLVTTTDYTKNALLPRTAKDSVWQQIIADLKDAANLLSPDNLDGTLLSTTTDRLRPTQAAAAALLARAYLYTGDFGNAAIQASVVINNPSYSLSSLDNAFLSAGGGNKEAIWQLEPVYTGVNAEEARFFVMDSTGPSTAVPFYLAPDLVNAFEPGDLRLTHWVGHVTVSGNTYYFPYKYKVNIQPSPITEYEMVLRLGEVYLLRAEAEAHGAGAGLSGAIADLDTIRSRAGLTGYSGPNNQDSLLAAIMHERQIELFTEWGNRWLDLLRTGKANNVLGSPGNVCQSKGGTWSPNAQLYPLSLDVLKADPNLVQNLGY